MKINNIKINAYGKLKDKNFDFKEGINVIKGDNESGKSTLLNYITDIFYGISRNKEGKEISDFDRYKPWTGEEFSGRIGYTLDNGKKYEIYREFKSKNPKIYNEKMEDISSEYNIDKKEGNKFFFEQTKIDKSMYLSTLVSMQQEVRLERKDQNILIQKIANIASSGDDNISYKKANEKLQNKIRDEIGTNKTSQKPINILQNNIEELNMEISKTEEYQNRKYEIDREKEDIIEKIEKEKSKRDFANKLNDIKNKNKSEKQKLIILENNKKENELKLKELYNQKDTFEISKKRIDEEKAISECNLKKAKEKITEYEDEQSTNSDENVEKSKKNLQNDSIILIIFMALFIINICTINNYIISIIIGALIAVTLIVGIAKKVSKNKQIKEDLLNKNKAKEEINKNIEEINEKIKILEQKHSELLTNLNEIVRQISSIEGKINLLEDSNEQLTKQIETLNLTINETVKMETEELIKNNSSNDNLDWQIVGDRLTIEINSINENISYLENKLNKIEVEESIVMPKLENLVILKEKKESYEEDLKELERQAEIINISIDCLKEAYEEMKSSITPKFAKELSESIKKISNDKYSKVTINDEKGMIVENENGEYIDIERLSTGTIDELYLSLRLSMIDELSEESMPILLDETFAYFDTKRIESTMNYLKEKSNKHQIILFTCSNREIEALNKLNYEYNVIDL